MLTTTAALWLAVFVSGLYHGLNPGMGWPLAVSSSLMAGQRAALWPALGALAVGHFLAMLVILLPFALMVSLLEYERALRLGGGTLVIALGLYLLMTRKHPRFLARVPPRKLALWSFLVALVHGAALMLVPIYLGLCAPEELDTGHRAAGALMSSNMLLTLTVAAAHTLAMVVAGGALAFATVKWLGLQAIRSSWLDLERVWALSLVLVGGIGVASALPV